MLPAFLNTGNCSRLEVTVETLPPAYVSFVNQFTQVPVAGNLTLREFDWLERRGATRISWPRRYVVSSVKVIELDPLSNAAAPVDRR
jgi:hypothetical protein